MIPASGEPTRPPAFLSIRCSASSRAGGWQNLKGYHGHPAAATPGSGAPSSRQATICSCVAPSTATAQAENDDMPLAALPELISQLEDQMKTCAQDLEFEEAAKLRDRIRILRQKLVGSS